MMNEGAVLLHGSTGEIIFSEYLSRVGLHLLAVAVVAVVVHWWSSVSGRPSAESVVEGNGEESEQ